MQKQRMDVIYGLMILTVALSLMLLWPGLLQNLLVANGFMPHGHCYLWKPALVWLHLSSDTLIGLAYVSISATLTYLVYKARREIPYHWMFLAFGLFIVACGATHFMEVWTLWTPVYWLAGEIKLITAVASVTTAIMLPPLVPQVLNLLGAAKSSEERRIKLENANEELKTLYEKLKQLDEVKSQFFTNVSHELRTPLALILGPTENLLASQGLTQKQVNNLKVVNRNARTLLKHVNDLLDVSKLESGKMQVNYAEVDLARLVRLSAAHFETLASDRHISFVVETPEFLSAQVDPDKLQRICLNLLSNAFKFTPDSGAIRCVLKTDTISNQEQKYDIQSDLKTSAIISIEDSGSGVPDSLKDVIFEPFRQGEIGNTRRFGGTGLGLAIVKEFVELHGGSITVEEAVTGGAIFTVVLPLVAPVGSEVRQQISDDVEIEEVVLQLKSEINSGQAQQMWSKFVGDTEQEKLESPTTNEHTLSLVLVVEDNPEMNQFISETLATKYRTVSAFNGQEGLEKALELIPDLIISDIMMPQLSGDQLVIEVRKHRELDNTPIVLLTAKADDRLRVQLLRSGAQDYLSKPFSSEEMRSRVDNLIAMKKAREVLQQQLDSTNQDVVVLAKEVALRQRELQNVATELEIRVEQRTLELKTANQLLKQEITQRQQAQTELETEKEFLKAVLDNVEAGIVACDAQGMLTIFNRVTREFHGLPESTIPAEEWAQYYKLYQPDRQTLMKKEEIPVWRALQGEHIRNLEMILVSQDNLARVILASGQPMLNPQGKKLGAVVVMHDITERKQAEEERAQLIREQMARAEAEASKWRFEFLAQARMELSASLDYETTLSGVAGLAVPILSDYCIIDLVDQQGAIQRVEVAHINPEKEELIRELQLRYPPDINSPLGIAKVLSTGRSEILTQVDYLELEAFINDPEYLQFMRQLNPVSAMLVPLTTRGRTIGAISLVSADSNRYYDQTDLSLAEDLAHSIAASVDNARLYREAQEANRLKDEFLAVLSHELRTPLNSMLGWVTLLRTRKFDETKTSKALETIERNARSQLRMIEELLDVSRIIKGKLQLNLRQVDLISVVETAVDTLRPSAEAKGIKLETLVDLPVRYVSGDADRLQQVVWNLLSNAIKFTLSNGRVEVRLNCVDNQAQIQVSDTGQGIAPEFIPYVFERFRQENSSTTRSHGGLGLGLAIVRHLVELHGGKVSAESAGIDRGATFKVQLPLINNQEVANQNFKNTSSSAALNSQSLKSKTLKGLRILVVDDEADAREVMTTVLEQFGAEVTAKDSVRQALEVLELQLPDILVSDIGMPTEDGYSLISQWRRREGISGKHLPAVALTAYASEQDRERALAAGFDLHVGKPVNFTDLALAIAQLTKVNSKT
ncbi:MAG TPA: ATP-binding protein [Oculatellaceae cyanobacterium]